MKRISFPHFKRIILFLKSNLKMLEIVSVALCVLELANDVFMENRLVKRYMGLTDIFNVYFG